LTEFGVSHVIKYWEVEDFFCVKINIYPTKKSTKEREPYLSIS